MSQLINKAYEWATGLHADTNHKYNDKPYEVHLEHVVEVAFRYKGLVDGFYWEIVLAACWAHDTIEDCRVSYNDVKKELGEEVAELVYALTNEKGKNRKQRANDKYYQGIKNTPYATFVKLCDRIANFEYSLNAGSKMAQMYARETQRFYDQLAEKQYTEMFDYLFKLEEQVKTKI